MNPRPSVTVAVVMERVAQPNRWEDWGHRVLEVIADEGGFGTEPRKLHDDGKVSQWLHPGHKLELFADECKGYFLNLTAGQPVWFVMWRAAEDDPSGITVEAVSLSYNEAGRWLDAQERVDNVPLGAELTAWLQAYADEHYRPEPKKRRRPQSFLPPELRR